MCRLLLCLLLLASIACSFAVETDRPRVIVTTDGEADDRCSMVRFLLTCNEFEVEGIVNTSSQFHWQGGEGWNAFHSPSWVKDYIALYAKVYPQLRKHDANYPSPEQLLRVWKVGNISAIGEDKIRTDGAEWIAKVLLDESDPRPVWVQGWGGCNTISRALKIIEKDHPEEMKRVAEKLRLFLIWEQDGTYQSYIRPRWEPLGVCTIISDQFDCMAYIWPKVLPEDVKPFFEAKWMKERILDGHGPLCAAYEHKDGAFQAEGDTPAFLHNIPTGLRSMENPGWGGWAGRYVKVRHNVWMDPLPSPEWKRFDGQITIDHSVSKQLENASSPDVIEARARYFKPITRWLPTVQNDFAARADWCVKDYADANHHPLVKVRGPSERVVSPGEMVSLDASTSSDPDGDTLSFRWWFYPEASDCMGFAWAGSREAKATLTIPKGTPAGSELHFICEVKDNGSPPLTRYQRVVLRVK